jgi:hypothetical protein
VLTQLVSGRLSILPVYVVLLVLGIGWKRIRTPIRRLVASEPRADLSAGSSDHPLALKALLLFIGVCVIVTTLAGFKAGLGWDAWTFWQLKARAFYIDGNMSYLKDTSHCFHPQYPPMIPLLSYWVFAHARSTADIWPQVIGLIFYLDLLAVSYASFRLWVHATPALACTALIASSRIVQKYALAGYADVAASAFMLTVAVFIVRRFMDKDRKAGPPLLWMLALTYLVKNETIAWTIAALLTVSLLGIVQRAKSALICFVGFGAGFLPWFWLQSAWRLSDEITTQPAGRIPISAALASSVDLVILLAKSAATIGPRYPAWGLFPILFIAGLFVAARRRNTHVVPLLSLVTLQFIGYIVVLVWAIWVNPDWYSIYVNDTLHRCLLQVFPTMLLMAALGCFMPRRAADQADAPASSNQKDSAAAPVN